MSKGDFEGFGASKEFGIPHFRVEIPCSLQEDVVIIEDFGFTEGASEEKRARVPRKLWAKIAQEVASDFNLRLKARKIPVGKWSVGTVKVERLLGKELCMLAWAVEFANANQIEIAIAKWRALRPEERWWLFTMTAAEAGHFSASNHGWRVALRNAIGCESTTIQSKTRTKHKKVPSAQNKSFEAQLSLFSPSGAIR